MAEWVLLSREVTQPTISYELERESGLFRKVEATEEVTEWKLTAPNGKVYEVSKELGQAVIGDLQDQSKQIERFKALEAEAWLTAKEDALLQASHEFLDHFQKRDALMRSKRAMGGRLVES